MKKWAVISKAVILTTILAACSQTEQLIPGVTKEETKNITLEEVFANAIEVLEQTNSIEAKVETKQTMEQPARNSIMESSSSMDIKLAAAPLALYQTGTTTMTIAGSQEKQTMNMEMYMTEQGFFMKDEETQQWIKMPSEMYDQIVLATKQQMEPAEQLKQLEPFQGEMNFEQTKTDYILKLSASGDKFEPLIYDQLNQFMPELQTKENKEATKKALEQTEIQKVNYIVHIDKNTFETKLIQVGTKMKMTEEKETTNLHQTVQTDYSEYNGNEDIAVPKDIMENAEEMHF